LYGRKCFICPYFHVSILKRYIIFLSIQYEQVLLTSKQHYCLTKYNVQFFRLKNIGSCETSTGPYLYLYYVFAINCIIGMYGMKHLGKK
jgi:hypothetical protein